MVLNVTSPAADGFKQLHALLSVRSNWAAAKSAVAPRGAQKTFKSVDVISLIMGTLPWLKEEH